MVAELKKEKKGDAEIAKLEHDIAALKQEAAAMVRYRRSGLQLPC
jgi:hypothetical protein